MIHDRKWIKNGESEVIQTVTLLIHDEKQLAGLVNRSGIWVRNGCPAAIWPQDLGSITCVAVIIRPSLRCRHTDKILAI